MSKHLDDSYTWRVEFAWKSPDQKWYANKSVSVICERIETAIAQVYEKWPEANIHKAFRGQHWGNEGVIIVDEGG